VSARRRGGTPVARAAGIPAAALVIVIAIGAFAIDRGTTVSPPAALRGITSVDGPSIPPASALSAAWYCAEGTSTVDGRATETIIVGNLAKHPIDVTVTVMPGGALPPVVRHRRIDTLAQARIPIADVLETPEPGVVVEVFGGQAVVEHELASRDDVAVGPCARAPSRDWYFADGSTERGAEEWLALFNPFGENAIVDVSFLSPAGFQAPGETQGVVVAPFSRVSIAVHDAVRRQASLAIAVHARTGRIVAERTQIFDGSDTRKGLAVSLGATGSARRWRLPTGDGQAGAATSISLANFGLVPTEVTVGFQTDGDAKVRADKVRVPARGVVRVDLAGKVATGVGYAVDLKVTGKAPVVAEQFEAWVSPATVTGVASTVASTTTARRWAFAVGRLDEQGDALVTALNVSGRPLTVQLYAYTAGNPNSPTSAPAQAVPPGARAVFHVLELGVRPEMVFVVSADGQIVAGREVLGAPVGVSLSPGVPFLR
jgi:hypothetical protein